MKKIHLMPAILFLLSTCGDADGFLSPDLSVNPVDEDEAAALINTIAVSYDLVIRTLNNDTSPIDAFEAGTRTCVYRGEDGAVVSVDASVAIATIECDGTCISPTGTTGAGSGNYDYRIELDRPVLFGNLTTIFPGGIARIDYNDCDVEWDLDCNDSPETFSEMDGIMTMAIGNGGALMTFSVSDDFTVDNAPLEFVTDVSLEDPDLGGTSDPLCSSRSIVGNVTFGGEEIEIDDACRRVNECGRTIFDLL